MTQQYGAKLHDEARMYHGHSRALLSAKPPFFRLEPIVSIVPGASKPVEADGNELGMSTDLGKRFHR